MQFITCPNNFAGVPANACVIVHAKEKNQKKNQKSKICFKNLPKSDITLCWKQSQ